METNTQIGIWATGLWLNLGSPTWVSALTISGFSYQDNTLGTLNSRIGTCYEPSGFLGTGEAFSITPTGMSNAELAIIGAIYSVTYFNQLMQRSMGAGGSDTPWLVLKEADSSIARTNPATIGKEYREAVKDANAYLNYLVGAYLDGWRGVGDVSYLNPPSPAAFPYGYPGGIYGLQSY